VAGLLSISFPLIVHVAWLYSTNAQLSSAINLASEIANLYMYSIGVIWRPLGLYLLCRNDLFCDSYPKNVETFNTYIGKVVFINLTLD
jgi:hypothetical protein